MMNPDVMTDFNEEPKKSLLFDEKLFFQKVNDRVSLSPKEYAEKYQIKAPDKVEMEFVEWYSGMSKDKILRAYERWRNENNIVNS